MRTQPGLFDTVKDPRAAEAARTQLRRMIEALRTTPVFPWKDKASESRDDSTFVQTMYWMDKAEAQTLWAEYDALAVALHEKYDHELED